MLFEPPHRAALGRWWRLRSLDASTRAASIQRANRPVPAVGSPPWARVRCPHLAGKDVTVSDEMRNIEALLSEHRVFEPPPGFLDGAVANDAGLYDRANGDYQAFWAEQAATLAWTRPWDTVM